MTPIHVIGDIAGHFKTLKALIAKLPAGRIILLGDLVDRGSHSKEVIQYCIDNNITSLLGNHEHIMLDYILGILDPTYKKFYGNGTWIPKPGQNFDNGGLATAMSYMNDSKFKGKEFSPELIKEIIPKEHIDFIKEMPMYLEIENLILTHAPIFGKDSFKKLADLPSPKISEVLNFQEDDRLKKSLIWNRFDPHQIKGKIQVFGHQGYKEVKYYSENHQHGIFDKKSEPAPPNPWGICIDTCKGFKLSALSYPSLEITQQDYID